MREVFTSNLACGQLEMPDFLHYLGKIAPSIEDCIKGLLKVGYVRWPKTVQCFGVPATARLTNRSGACIIAAPFRQT
jgi:hypothetical protein